MPTDTLCIDTLYVHTAPDSLASFAEECSFKIGHRTHTTKKNMSQLKRRQHTIPSM